VPIEASASRRNADAAASLRLKNLRKWFGDVGLALQFEEAV
jgi:hypothetical protein